MFFMLFLISSLIKKQFAFYWKQGRPFLVSSLSSSSFVPQSYTLSSDVRSSTRQRHWTQIKSNYTFSSQKRCTKTNPKPLVFGTFLFVTNRKGQMRRHSFFILIANYTLRSMSFAGKFFRASHSKTSLANSFELIAGYKCGGTVFLCFREF